MGIRQLYAVKMIPKMMSNEQPIDCLTLSVIIMIANLIWYFLLRHNAFYDVNATLFWGFLYFARYYYFPPDKYTLDPYE